MISTTHRGSRMRGCLPCCLFTTYKFSKIGRHVIELIELLSKLDDDSDEWLEGCICQSSLFAQQNVCDSLVAHIGDGVDSQKWDLLSYAPDKALQRSLRLFRCYDLMDESLDVIHLLLPVFQLTAHNALDIAGHIVSKFLVEGLTPDDVPDVSLRVERTVECQNVIHENHEVIPVAAVDYPDIPEAPLPGCEVLHDTTHFCPYCFKQTHTNHSLLS